MPRRITASALSLLRRCPGQSVLEHYPSTSDAAEEGTRQHDLLVPALIRGHLPDTARGRALEGIQVSRDAVAEVATALDLDCSARTLTPEYPRDYSGAEEHEIPGTCDWLVVGERGELKTGAVMMAPPARNAQMWHSALTAWWEFGQAVTMRLVHAPPPDKQDRSKALQWRYKPTIAELMRWHGEIKRAVDGVLAAREMQDRGGRLHLVLGDHCGRCDAVLVCPAIGEAVGHGNRASRALVARARRFAAAREEELANALLLGTETTEDGRKLRPITNYRRQIDTPAALARLPGLASFASTVVTAGDLDRYARTRVDLGHTIKQRKRELARLLEESGALTWTSSTRHEEQET